MVVTELDSFFQRFHQLWNAGLNAHVNLDAHAGNACVNLHHQLGHHPVPTFVPGWSCICRREKRAAARKNAEEASKAAKILKQNANKTKKAETKGDSTVEIVINEETDEKVTMEPKAVQVQDAIINDKEYNSKVLKVQKCVKKMCEVQINEHNVDIDELRQIVYEYFEKKTDVIV